MERARLAVGARGQRNGLRTGLGERNRPGLAQLYRFSFAQQLHAHGAGSAVRGGRKKAAGIARQVCVGQHQLNRDSPVAVHRHIEGAFAREAAAGRQIGHSHIHQTDRRIGQSAGGHFEVGGNGKRIGLRQVRVQRRNAADGPQQRCRKRLHHPASGHRSDEHY
ncbi:hypothetical protein G6F68_010744 [Rhizopus microsporus]|nr:hypothetical protein G6F68_010744 [Rhizopus microsporus]